MDDQACGDRRVGDHGGGHRRGGRQGRSRGRAAVPPAGHGRRHAGLVGEGPEPAGREGQASRRPTGTPPWPASRPPRCSRTWPTATWSSSRSSRTSPPRRPSSSSSTRSASDDAILATNTSTLPVIEMAVETHNPGRVCGIHFFNPAPTMRLVEIVRPLTASDETIAAAKAFAEACGKDPVEVKDRAGFIVNALLFPYLNNAVRMLENGTASPGGHRHRHEGRLQLPDGPAGAARPGRPRHVAWRSSTPSTTSSGIPTTRPCRSCGGWWRPASSAARPARASTTTGGSRSHGECGAAVEPRRGHRAATVALGAPFGPDGRRTRRGRRRVPTSSPAPCWPPTDRACSPCRWTAASWPGGHPTRGASSRSTASGCPARSGGPSPASRSASTGTFRR